MHYFISSNAESASLLDSKHCPAAAALGLTHCCLEVAALAVMSEAHTPVGLGTLLLDRLNIATHLHTQPCAVQMHGYYLSGLAWPGLNLGVHIVGVLDSMSHR